MTIEFTEIHSYSSLEKFHSCPRQFNEVRVLKNFKEDFSSKSSLEGKRVHDILEQAFRWKERDCHDEKLNPAIKKVWANIDNMAKKHGEIKIRTEAALGIGKNLERPCDFWDKSGGFRGKIDLLALSEKVAYVVDWKTGNPAFASMDQIEAMAYLVAQHFSSVEKIVGHLVFVNELEGSQIKIFEVDVDWETKFKENLYRKISRVENMKAEGGWFAQPNGLCKNHCCVRTCPHNGHYIG